MSVVRSCASSSAPNWLNTHQVTMSGTTVSSALNHVIVPGPQSTTRRKATAPYPTYAGPVAVRRLRSWTQKGTPAVTQIIPERSNALVAAWARSATMSGIPTWRSTSLDPVTASGSAPPNP